MSPLLDNWNRRFSYLRFSVTDRCQFRCTYCLPDGFQETRTDSDLSLDEISVLLEGFKKLGFSKVRFTGGEPTLRKDLPRIIQVAKRVGFSTIALTTNGALLDRYLNELIDSGLDQINISLDSLNSEVFNKISGLSISNKVLQNIQKTIESKIKKIKINTVLLKDINDRQFDDFLEWVRERPVTLRFIELMQTAGRVDYFKKFHLRNQEYIERLKHQGWSRIPRLLDSGPADEFQHSQYSGKVGFISAYERNFCDSCNRLRVSSRGDLRLCLFGDTSISLRPYLKSPDDFPMLNQILKKSLGFKKQSHFLLKGDSGDTQSLSSIGG